MAKYSFDLQESIPKGFLKKLISIISASKQEFALIMREFFKISLLCIA